MQLKEPKDLVKKEIEKKITKCGALFVSQKEDEQFWLINKDISRTCKCVQDAFLKNSRISVLCSINFKKETAI